MIGTGRYPRFKVSCLRCRRIFAHNKFSSHVCRTPEEKRLDNYWRQRKNGLNAGRVDRLGNPIEFRLSKSEVKQLLRESSISVWDIGTGAGKYQLARYDDIGHYEIGNCRFITHSENAREARTHSGFGTRPQDKNWETRRKRYGSTGVKNKANAGGWITRREKMK